MVEPGAFLEVADRELDLGVAAVIPLDLRQRLCAVGDEGVVAPVGEQLGLGADKSRAADDQPAPRQAALGDLGDPLRRVVGGGLPALLGMRWIARRTLSCWVTPIGSRTPCCSSAAIVLLLPKPESARTSSGPVAPRRRTRCTSSRTKRSAPRWLCADPLRIRACSTSPLSERVAAGGGSHVALCSRSRRPASARPATSTIVESRSIVSGSEPGPAPAAQARPRIASKARSSWRTWPNVNERRNVPSVEGAITR